MGIFEMNMARGRRSSQALRARDDPLFISLSNASKGGSIDYYQAQVSLQVEETTDALQKLRRRERTPSSSEQSACRKCSTLWELLDPST